MAEVAGGPQDEGDQEGDWAAWRLDQCPGDGGDPEETGGPMLGRRGQWQHRLIVAQSQGRHSALKEKGASLS